MYISAAPRRRLGSHNPLHKSAALRGLGGLGSQAMPLSLATNPTAIGGDSIPWYCSYLLYMPWLGSYSACVAPAIASGPASVVTNAQTFYGQNSPAAQAAASAAAVQEASAESDAAGIANYYDPYSLGGYNANPSSGLPWWAWVAIVAAGVVVVKVS